MKSKHLFKEAFKAGYKKAIKESNRVDGIGKTGMLNTFEKQVAMELLQIIAQEFHNSAFYGNSIEEAANVVAHGLASLLDEYCNKNMDEAIMYATDELSYIVSDSQDVDEDKIIRYIFSLVEDKINYKNL